MLEVFDFELLLGIAVYKPASANKVSRTSSERFMGEFSCAGILRVRMIHQFSLSQRGKKLWINMKRCFVPERSSKC